MRSMLEKMLRSGNHSLVLQEAARYFKGRTSASEDDVWVCIHACLAAGATKEWGQAADWAEQGLRLNSADREAEGRLRFFGGTALFYTSNFYGAETELRKFHKLVLRCTTLKSLVGDAFYNLAYVMRALKRRKAEIAAFRSAAEAYTRQARHARVNVCQYEIAWSYLMDEKVSLASRALDAAEQGLATEPDSELEVDIVTARALFHHLKGDNQTSRRLCLGLLERMEMGRRQLAEVLWVLARNALAAGDVVEADHYIEQAYSATLADWVPTQVRRIEALKLQVSAAYETGR
jgi:tetratricopeptide (TPR) repeat protein